MTEDTQNDEVALAYNALMDAIVTQRLAPSQKVSENILVDMFEISRTTARNLIERLTARQFLVSVSARVTTVAPLTLLDIKQNFMLRKVLLPTIFSLSSSKLDFERLQDLNSEIASMQPVKNDADALALLKKNKEMNLGICRDVGYPLMIDWATQLEDTAMRIYWLYLKSEGRLPYASDQQANTLNLLRSDEPTRLKSMIHDVLSQTEERILTVILSSEQFFTQDLKA